MFPVMNIFSPRLNFIVFHKITTRITLLSISIFFKAERISVPSHWKGKSLIAEIEVELNENLSNQINDAWSILTKFQQSFLPKIYLN